MFRKFLIAAVASLALLSPLAFPAQSDAHGPRSHRSAAHRYHARRHVHRAGPWRVYYRTYNTGPWLINGSFACRADAVRAAASMNGCQTVIR
jgi:hypothetical protein